MPTNTSLGHYVRGTLGKAISIWLDGVMPMTRQLGKQILCSILNGRGKRRVRDMFTILASGFACERDQAALFWASSIPYPP
jgi:hypothetical protein